MKKQYVWTCDFCGKEFDKKKECDSHELICKKNKNREILLRIKVPDKHTLFVLVSIFLGIYLLIFSLVDSYAKTNGLGKKYLTNPSEWFSSEEENQIIPTLTPTPEITLTPTKKPKTQTNKTNNIQSDLIECIGPDGKHFDTSMTECKNLAEKWGKRVDYMVNCVYSAECGGETKRIAKSECDIPCKSTNSNQSAQCSKKVAFTSSAMSNNRTYYCCEEKVNEMARLEDALNIQDSTSDICSKTAELESENCSSGCTMSDSNQLSDCINSCVKTAYSKCSNNYSNAGDNRKRLIEMIYKYCP